MATLKNNWLRAITLGLFMMGLIFTSQAGEIDPPKKEKTIEVAATKHAVKAKKVATQSQWFTVTKINPSGSDVLSNYQIVSTNLTPPSNTGDDEICDQQNTSGRFCEIQLEFADTANPDDALNKDVATAMNDLSASHTGSARNPSQP